MASRIAPKDPNDGESIVMRLHLPQDGMSEFVLPAKKLMAGDSFRDILGGQGVVAGAKQMKDIIGVDPGGKSTEEKMAILRKYRTDLYNKVVDVAYKRRGWTKSGVPKIDRLKELGIDLPELIEIVKSDQ